MKGPSVIYSRLTDDTELSSSVDCHEVAEWFQGDIHRLHELVKAVVMLTFIGRENSKD